MKCEKKSPKTIPNYYLNSTAISTNHGNNSLESQGQAMQFSDMKLHNNDSDISNIVEKMRVVGYSIHTQMQWK